MLRGRSGPYLGPGQGGMPAGNEGPRLLRHLILQHGSSYSAIPCILREEPLIEHGGWGGQVVPTLSLGCMGQWLNVLLLHRASVQNPWKCWALHSSLRHGPEKPLLHVTCGLAIGSVQHLLADSE